MPPKDFVIENSEDDSPGIDGIRKPPVAFLAAVGAGVAAGHFLSTPTISDVVTKYTGRTPSKTTLMVAGGAVAATALAMFAWGGSEMRGKTPIPTYKPARQLITSWLHRNISRNPIYLGMTLFPSGVGIATNNPWLFASSALFAAYIGGYVIPREEAYLARRFQSEYTEFKNSSARWFVFV